MTNTAIATITTTEVETLEQLYSLYQFYIKMQQIRRSG